MTNFHHHTFFISMLRVFLFFSLAVRLYVLLFSITLTTASKEAPHQQFLQSLRARPDRMNPFVNKWYFCQSWNQSYLATDNQAPSQSPDRCGHASHNHFSLPFPFCCLFCSYARYMARSQCQPEMQSSQHFALWEQAVQNHTMPMATLTPVVFLAQESWAFFFFLPQPPLTNSFSSLLSESAKFVLNLIIPFMPTS